MAPPAFLDRHPPCQGGPEEAQGCGCLESLDTRETFLLLLALALVAQLAMKLATLIGYYVCSLLRNLCRIILTTESEQLRSATTTLSKPQHWSEPDVTRRKRWESSPRHPPCLHCTRGPVELNIHLPCKEHHRGERRPCPNCKCGNPYCRQSVSAPSACVTRYRDVACGSSEPMLFPGSSERKSSLPYPRTQVGEIQHQDSEYPGGTATHSRQPAKLYTYVVHPQTPTMSRSASPERAHRRRVSVGVGTEERQENEPRAERTVQTDQMANTNWVFRPVK